MAANERVTTSSPKQTIEELQARFQRLHTKKIQAQTSLEHALELLKRLQAEARQKYETDDVAALRAKLEEMKTDNENKRREYQSSLDRIESALHAVETNLSLAESSADHHPVSQASDATTPTQEPAEVDLNTMTRDS